MGRVTLRDVAERAGVSQTAVSFVLNERPHSAIPPATRERVRRAVAELGYRPNSLARSLALGRSHTLGFVITNLTNPVFGEVAETLQRAAREQGYDLLIALDDGNAELEQQQIDRLLDRRVDGLLLWGGHSRRSFPCLQRLREQHVPFVVLVTPEEDGGTSFVATDRPAGMEQAVAHLTGLGYTRIGYVGSDVREPNPLPATKYDGFLAALKRRGLAPAASLRIPMPGVAPREARALGYEVGRRVAGDTERPRALICTNDVIALGVMAGLRDGGVSVPGGMAVVGYDGIAEGEFSNPRLTTLAQPLSEMVDRGLRALLRRIAAPDAPPERILLSPRLLVRESCGSTLPPEQRDPAVRR